MLPATSSPIRTALNRVTFGARDTDVAIADNIGWGAWVDDQLRPPVGDDPALASHLARQTMKIKYAAPAENDTRGQWLATDEDRTLNYINADTPTLWNITRNAGSLFSNAERTRIRQELAAATWIRNGHSRYQLREFMVDFWHNHFNIGKNENELATSLLPVFDRATIRPNAFGNFRTLLEATATAPSMLIYLDNWVSSATTPNENYAREIMELHTLGGTAYLGTASPATVAMGPNGLAVGFTDTDVIQASRALSGWTIGYGQAATTGTMPNTGEFAFNARQHNKQAGAILGYNVSSALNDMTQGQRLINILAYHPATASFVVGKLARRIFGDTPPQAVIDRGLAAWLGNQMASDQIARVLRAMLTEGTEVMTVPPSKVRRPYERIIAMARTTEMIFNAGTFMTSLLDGLNDGLFAWQAPNGRPDVNDFWLATGATIATWNLLFQVPNFTEFTAASLTMQSPQDAMTSPTAITEYWVGRMVGHQLNTAAMTSLVADQAGSNGVPAIVKTRNVTAARIETAHRRLISLIATSEEFSLR